MKQPMMFSGTVLCRAALFVTALFSISTAACKQPSSGGGGLPPDDPPVAITFNGNGGFFGSQGELTVEFAAGGSLGSLPPPERGGYQFIGYNTRANRSGAVFDADAVAYAAMTVYAQWMRDDHKSGIEGLVLRHSFDNVPHTRAAGVQPAYPVDGGDDLFAAARGVYGSLPQFESRTINGETYWFYRSGAPRAMDDPDAAYLDLGAGAGSLIKNEAFTIAFYVRIPEDYNHTVPTANGHMVIAFAGSNNIGANAGHGMYVQQQPNGYFQWSTTDSGYNSPNNVGVTVSSHLGRWIHLAFVRGGAVWRIYENGIQRGASALATLPLVSAMDALVFNTLAGPPFRNNSIQARTLYTDFRIYQRELDANEIMSLSDSLAGLNDPLVTDWNQAAQLVHVPIETALIQPGTFIMGSGSAVDLHAQPQHLVTLTGGFYMGKYPVTQEQWESVMGEGTNPSYFHGGPGREPAAGEVQGKRPVETVSWFDAIVFCNRLSLAEGLAPAYSINGSANPDLWLAAPTNGLHTNYAAWNAVQIAADSAGYRLPTEAQWEYACRAGTITAFNSGSDDPGTIAWYGENSGGRTHEAGIKAPNAWGLYDMHGNVWEWCWDSYEAYSGEVQADPSGPAAVTSAYSQRIVRGGSVNNAAFGLRSAYRSMEGPWAWGIYIGLRVVRPAF